MKRFGFIALLLLLGCEDGFGPIPTGTTGNYTAFSVVQPRRVIVTLAAGEDPSAVVTAHGITPDFTYVKAINGFAGTISDAARAGLMRDRRVLRVEPDGLVQATDTRTGATWGLDRIDQRGLPLDATYTYDLDGAGVTAYILDTGIRYDHVDFGSRASKGYDAFGGDGSDCHSHGSHVAGTVGGRTWGVASSVRLVSIRVMDCTGSGSWSGVIAGIDWIIRNNAGPAVANMSFSGPTSTSLDDAVRRLIAAGVVVTLSAGNSNTSACGSSPTRVAEALTVGATDKTDTRASFSNYGTCLDLFAPGVGIVSVDYSTTTGSRTKSGTSMAAPHVAGVAALAYARYPGSSAAAIADTVVAWTTKGVVRDPQGSRADLLFSSSGIGGGGGGVNRPPTADFDFVCTDLDCSFNDRSVDSDGSIVSTAWAFGDGATATSAATAHAYKKAGSYTVSLSVTDNGGATASRSRTVSVSAPVPPSPISLTVAGYKVKGTQKVDLSWGGVSTTLVDIFRDGALIARASNSGRYTDNLNRKNGGPYMYRVCETGTNACSVERSAF